MTTLAITLREEDGYFLEEVVRSGRYLTKDDAVAEAVSELRVREALRQERVAELRAQVMVGIEQADRRVYSLAAMPHIFRTHESRSKVPTLPTG